MTYVISICIDHEENVVANLTNRLHANFTVLATIVRSLKCGTQEDASSIFEAQTSFFESAVALGFVSVVGSRTAAYQIGFVSKFSVGLRPLPGELTLRLFVLLLAQTHSGFRK